MTDDGYFQFQDNKGLILDAYSPYHGIGEDLTSYCCFEDDGKKRKQPWNKFQVNDDNTISVYKRKDLGYIGTNADLTLVLTKDPSYTFIFCIDGKGCDSDAVVVVKAPNATDILIETGIIPEDDHIMNGVDTSLFDLDTFQFGKNDGSCYLGSNSTCHIVNANKEPFTMSDIAKKEVISTQDQRIFDITTCKLALSGTGESGSVMGQCDKGRITYSYYSDPWCKTINKAIYTGEVDRNGTLIPIMKKPGAFILCGDLPLMDEANVTEPVAAEAASDGSYQVRILFSMILINAFVLLGFN